MPGVGNVPETTIGTELRKENVYYAFGDAKKQFLSDLQSKLQLTNLDFEESAPAKSW